MPEEPPTKELKTLSEVLFLGTKIRSTCLITRHITHLSKEELYHHYRWGGKTSRKSDLILPLPLFWRKIFGKFCAFKWIGIRREFNFQKRFQGPCVQKKGGVKIICPLFWSKWCKKKGFFWPIGAWSCILGQIRYELSLEYGKRRCILKFRNLFFFIVVPFPVKWRHVKCMRSLSQYLG